MEEKTIYVDQLITCHKGITPDEGKPILDDITKSFNEKIKVNLDFTNVELMTTACLNVAIGDLYRSFQSETIRGYLNIVGCSDSLTQRILKVIKTAKSFYQNPEQFNKIIDSVL